MMEVKAGVSLVEVITLGYRANRPILLHGCHGLGKSEILAQAATQLGISCLSRDLSLMEPPDLVGIPQIKEDGKTYYAVPSFIRDRIRGLNGLNTLQ